MPRLGAPKICLLILKRWLEGRGTAGISFRTKASKSHLHTLPLPHSRVQISPGGELLLSLLPAFLWLPPRACPLISWLWRTVGLYVPGPHRTIVIGKTVLGRRPCPRHCKDSRLKYILSLPEKEAHLLFLELQPEGQLSGLPHS